MMGIDVAVKPIEASGVAVGAVEDCRRAATKECEEKMILWETQVPDDAPWFSR